MPDAAASNPWSAGQNAWPRADDGSVNPVTAGLWARTGSPAAAIAASKAALSTVLPTPVSVAVTKSPVTRGLRLRGARDGAVPLAVEGRARAVRIDAIWRRRAPRAG